MAHALTEAEIDTVIVLPIDGLVITHAGKHGLTSIIECIRKGTSEIVASVEQVGSQGSSWSGAGRSGSILPGYNPLIDVNGLVLMQAESVCVLRFKNGVVVDGPGITDIEFLGNRISVARIDQAPDAAVRGGGGRTC